MNHLPLNPSEISQESNKKISRQDLITRKNRTIKKRKQERITREHQEKYNVRSLVKSMHGDDDSDDESELGNYNPPPKPELQQRPSHGDTHPSQYEYNPSKLSSNNDDQTNDQVVTPEGFRGIDKNSNDAYNQYVPYFTSAGNNQSIDGPKDKLLEKLNYMIHLLEEQKEEKTNHVAEELILYSFLGVFVIFIVDSFARVGKYVR